MNLEPLTAAHLPLLVDLDGDPEVMRYLLGRARTPQEAQAHWSRVCDGMVADCVGLGFWVGFIGDDFVGWWSASPPLPVTKAPASAELGWRLVREYWGQGYATEGARAIIEHCFTTVGITLLTAETMAANEGSRGVMRSLGMRQVRTEHRTWDDPLPGAELGEVVYELSVEDWRHEPPVERR